ncbi:cyclin-dependent kinase inhibitor [Musa troglodytarum]|uniref:Cyclin-dependent kinase inhibitor n=1 Tax=Musa troglodytarum TaxID=320322 RepID=A0A9E7L1E7_9LILI|nr:cyclin-dependent kinase inhibitor [Musa troglodytarum]URE42338.1 cyclin-dependent kinase inhibitor [Musa troglodytarum]URE42343.1 cyclin-dependent kinase inhibitor [Musa troglodytarum]
MGKYTRKCSRGVGELAVMEVTQVVGVRTRGRSHSLAAAAAAAVESPRRRRTAAPPSTEVVQTSSYLQLRSRPLFMTIRRPRLQAENSAAASDPGPAAEGISQCSSNASSEVVGGGKKGVVLGSSTCNFKSRRARLLCLQFFNFSPFSSSILL